MKNILTLILLDGLLLGMLGCEEDFSPLGDYHEQYAVTAQLNIDSSSHIILISKSSAQHLSNDPNEFVFNHLSGAEVKVFVGENVFLFQEVLNTADNQKINSKIIAYYEYDGIIPGYNNNLRLAVLTPDGDRLSAETKTTKKLFFDVTKSAQVFPPESEAVNFIEIIWDTTRKELYSYKNFYFTFYRMIDGEFKRFTREIPSDFVKSGKEPVAQYFRFNNQTGFAAQKEAVEKTLLSISESDENKSSYFIGRIYLEVYQMDEVLSRYYSSVGAELDQYSVQIGMNDYTNIKGGFGVFGSYSKNVFIIPIQWEYIRSLGYTPYAEH